MNPQEWCGDEALFKENGCSPFLGRRLGSHGKGRPGSGISANVFSQRAIQTRSFVSDTMFQGDPGIHSNRAIHKNVLRTFTDLSIIRGVNRFLVPLPFSCLLTFSIPVSGWLHNHPSVFGQGLEARSTWGIIRGCIIHG